MVRDGEGGTACVVLSVSMEDSPFRDFAPSRPWAETQDWKTQDARR